jgi:hypothetical protein
MRADSFKSAVLIGTLLSVALLLPAQVARKIYAQKLVDEVTARHPDLVVFAMHVTAPGTETNTIIASNEATIIGKKSDADDLEAIHSPRPVTELSADKTRFEVLLPLEDRSGQKIGALVTVFRYKAGDNQRRLIARALHLRDQIRPRIASLAELFRVTDQ